MTTLKLGMLVKVIKKGPEMYLTEGEVYKVSALSQDSIGLHRPTNGAGTYTKLSWVANNQVVLEQLGE